MSSFPNGLCGSANTVLVISKWGSAGLYIHNGYTCPYTADYSGDATTVRYYRKANHTHTYSNTQITDSTLSIKFHSSACHGVGCGQEIYAPHNWVEVRINPSSVSPQYVPGYQCSDCGYVRVGIYFRPFIEIAADIIPAVRIPRGRKAADNGRHRSVS